MPDQELSEEEKFEKEWGALDESDQGWILGLCAATIAAGPLHEHDGRLQGEGKNVLKRLADETPFVSVSAAPTGDEFSIPLGVLNFVLSKQAAT